MLTSPDFLELLNLFKNFKVRFLVVGGYAVMKYAEPRFTKDLALWISTDRQNADDVYSAFSRDSRIQSGGPCSPQILGLESLVALPGKSRFSAKGDEPKPL